MSRPFVITGSGRSGTLWAAEVLRACHLRVGHQAVYRHEQTLGRRIHWGQYHGDSSFEAVPLLHTFKPQTLIVLLLRNPLDSIRSWRRKGLFVDRIETWEKWALLTRVLDRHFPEVLAHEDPLTAAAQFWVSWIGEARKHAHVTLKVEETSAQQLCEAVDRPAMYITKGDDVSRTTNATPSEAPDRGPHEYADIPEVVRGPLMEMAGEFGYGV